MSYFTLAQGEGSDCLVQAELVRKSTLSTVAPSDALASEDASAWLMAPLTDAPFWMTASLEARVPDLKWNSES